MSNRNADAVEIFWLAVGGLVLSALVAIPIMILMAISYVLAYLLAALVVFFGVVVIKVGGDE